jgi:hypothetical protein
MCVLKTVNNRDEIILKLNFRSNLQSIRNSFYFVTIFPSFVFLIRIANDDLHFFIFKK